MTWTREAPRPAARGGAARGGAASGVDWLWVLAWGVASSVWCITAARQLSATFDEPLYITRGLEGWRSGSHSGLIKLGTMPLPVDVCTLPLYLWERWHGTLLDPMSAMSSILPWARAGTLLFWWVLLVYGWRIGWQLGGRWSGRLAVALLAGEPSLLAHAALATTDIAVSACLLALLYHFRTGRDAGWVPRVGLPAWWFAACVLAKASGLLYAPICLVVVEVERVVRAGVPSSRAERSKASTRDVAAVIGCGLVMVFVYCGTDWRAQPSFVAWAHGLPDTTINRGMVWLAEHLRIFGNAGEGIVRQVRHAIRGHSYGAYLLGGVRPGFWYYFPVALSIKLTLPLLFLPLVVLAVQPRALLNWATLAAAALLLFSLTSRVQIGVRFVLPLVALAAVGIAAAVVRTCNACASKWSWQLLATGTAGAVVWTAAAAAAVWPEGLCYANELWGGTARGYLYLSDSNYDWGQGLTELRRWQEAHGAVALDVWYFGTDPAVHRPPLREMPLHVLQIATSDDVAATVRGHWVAASTTLLYGAVMNPAHGAAAAFLRGRQPVARTSTFFIYDFTQEPDSAAERKS